MESDEQFLNTVNECMSSLSSAVAPVHRQEFIDTITIYFTLNQSQPGEPILFNMNTSVSKINYNYMFCEYNSQLQNFVDHV